MTMIETQTQTEWPPSPYKGLSYYGPSDTPLFAGRDEDVQRCARFIASPAIRLTILHGTTGCGKSSFLRAGLIPFIEARGHGFAFLKSDARALFVRSTALPLFNLANAVAEFTASPISIETPTGSRNIDLSALMRGALQNWKSPTGPEPGDLVAALEEVARRLPQTLIVVVDQAEEVLTLNVGQDGRSNRDAFFKFISAFAKSQLDMKLLIAIRTEFYGRYRNAIQEFSSEQSAIAEFFLADLDEHELVEAIVRPTLDCAIGGLAAPRSRYGFKFEDGLPEMIAHDLAAANLTGGILPVAQIVCDALYRRINASKPENSVRVIVNADYISLGGIEEQVDKHLESVLRAYCTTKKIHFVDTEVNYWRNILSELARTQVDGTVTTELKPSADLQKLAAKLRTQLPFQETMEFLESEEQRIVRRVNVKTVAHEEPIVCYSLGHDVLGLPLLTWKKEQARLEPVRRRAKVAFFILGVCMLIVPAISIIRSLSSGHGPDWEAVIFTFYGLFFIAQAFLWKGLMPERVMRSYLRLISPVLPRKYRDQLAAPLRRSRGSTSE